MVVRLSGRNRITTSSGTVAPSFSSSQRVMGMTGVSGEKSRISWIEVRIRGNPIAPTVMAARHRNRTTPRCLTTHRPRPGKIPRWDSGLVASSSRRRRRGAWPPGISTVHAAGSSKNCEAEPMSTPTAENTPNMRIGFRSL